MADKITEFIEKNFHIKQKLQKYIFFGSLAVIVIGYIHRTTQDFNALRYYNANADPNLAVLPDYKKEINEDIANKIGTIIDFTLGMGTYAHEESKSIVKFWESEIANQGYLTLNDGEFDYRIWISNSTKDRDDIRITKSARDSEDQTLVIDGGLDGNSDIGWYCKKDVNVFRFTKFHPGKKLKPEKCQEELETAVNAIYDRIKPFYDYSKRLSWPDGF